jgi:uncharacterized repeat protein (TIGR03843 family)
MGKTNRKKRNEQVFQPEPNLVEVDFKEEDVLAELEPEVETASLPASPEELAASKAWRLALSAKELEPILSRGQFGALKLVPWGSNYTFITALCDEETGAEYAVIYKPRRGEVPLWDFPNGTLYKREYGAYLVSEALGWHFIPPVIIRDGPHGPGTVQVFIDADENVQYYQFREEHAHELKRIAIFDLITNNADRKAGHCLLGMDGYLWGIDHGLCFNAVPKLRTFIWDFSGEPYPEDIYQDLLEFATDPVRTSKLRTQLEELLDHREVDIFFKRLEQSIEKPVFPGLSSRRQIPWGMW